MARDLKTGNLSGYSTERKRAQFWRDYDIMQTRATAYCPLNNQGKQTGQFVPLVCFWTKISIITQRQNINGAIKRTNSPVLALRPFNRSDLCKLSAKSRNTIEKVQNNDNI